MRVVAPPKDELIGLTADCSDFQSQFDKADDPRGIGTPRLSDFSPAVQGLANGYALGLAHGPK